MALSRRDGWVDELVDILGRRNIKEESIPGASGLVKDLLLVVGDITSIEVVVSSEVVVLVGRGRVASSELKKALLN